MSCFRLRHSSRISGNSPSIVLRARRLAIILAGFLVAGSALTANCQSWQPVATAPPVCVGAMLLLTDGRVLVHSEPNGTTACTGSYTD